MDLVTKAQQALSPEVTPTLLRTASFHPSSPPSFPIIAIAIIGILATALLLVGYYVFVIKCCLSWHRVDILRRFSLARPHDEEDGLALRTALEPRGLDEATIRSIPVFLFKHDGNSDTECSVCLNEFEECQKLRLIPNCRHAFHVDCIDVWLQSNANCPLCRAAVTHFQLTDRILAPSSSPADPGPLGGDDDFVVIELGSGAGSARFGRRARKLKKGTSMGDECIDTKRDKDGEFSVQPIRRSFSMDSSADRKMFVAVQEALALQRDVNGGFNAEGSCSGNRSARRSFFSFGHGSRGSSRSAVLPVYLEP